MGVLVASAYLRQQSVASAGHRLQEARMFRIVVQCYTKLAHCGIDSLAAIDKDVLTPEPLHDGIAGDQLPLALHQQNQQFRWESFELDYTASLPQFIGVQVKLETVEAED
jgi:hypothetical protein